MLSDKEYEAKLAERMADIEKYNDAYQKMNITHGGVRIGFDVKKQYLDRLAELSANGYITPEEFDARVEWVNGALTRAQLEEAFKDLPPSITIRYPKKDKKKPGPYAVVQQWWFCFPFLVLEFVCTVTNFLDHNVTFGIICLIGAVWWAVLLGRAVKK